MRACHLYHRKPRLLLHVCVDVSASQQTAPKIVVRAWFDGPGIHSRLAAPALAQFCMLATVLPQCFSNYGYAFLRIGLRALLVRGNSQADAQHRAPGPAHYLRKRPAGHALAAGSRVRLTHLTDQHPLNLTGPAQDREL